MKPRDEYGDRIEKRDVCREDDLTDADRRSVQPRSRIGRLPRVVVPVVDRETGEVRR